MTIEKTLDRIANSLETLVSLHSYAPSPGALPVDTPAPAPAPAPTVPAPAPAVPAPVVPAVTLPFNDAKTLSAYVMSKYRSLGPVKGALIQNVLGELGLKNVNDVQPAQYEIFWAKVEAL